MLTLFYYYYKSFSLIPTNTHTHMQSVYIIIHKTARRRKKKHILSGICMWQVCDLKRCFKASSAMISSHFDPDFIGWDCSTVSCQFFVFVFMRGFLCVCATMHKCNKVIMLNCNFSHHFIECCIRATTQNHLQIRLGGKSWSLSSSESGITVTRFVSFSGLGVGGIACVGLNGLGVGVNSNADGNIDSISRVFFKGGCIDVSSSCAGCSRAINSLSIRSKVNSSRFAQSHLLRGCDLESESFVVLGIVLADTCKPWWS